MTRVESSVCWDQLSDQRLLVHLLSSAMPLCELQQWEWVGSVVALLTIAVCCSCGDAA